MTGTHRTGRATAAHDPERARAREMGQEWNRSPSPQAYYRALVGGELTSAFARELAEVPENPAATRGAGDDRFRVLVPVTGGLDSATLWAMAGEAGLPRVALYLDMGQPYAAAEVAAAMAVVDPDDLIVVETGRLPFKQWGHVLLGRNAVALAELSAWGWGHGYWGDIWFGALAGESPIRGGDKSHRFLLDIQRLTLGAGFRVCTPLAGLDKPDLVRWWQAPGRDLGRLRRAVRSCFMGGWGNCGRCQACFRLYVAFAAAGIEPWDVFPDGVRFAAHIEKYRRVMEQARADADYARYSPARIAATLAVLDALEGTDARAPEREREREVAG